MSLQSNVRAQSDALTSIDNTPGVLYDNPPPDWIDFIREDLSSLWQDVLSEYLGDNAAILLSSLWIFAELVWSWACYSWSTAHLVTISFLDIFSIALSALVQIIFLKRVVFGRVLYVKQSSVVLLVIFGIYLYIYATAMFSNWLQISCVHAAQQDTVLCSITH